jgi:hypothetical protein
MVDVGDADLFYDLQTHPRMPVEQAIPIQRDPLALFIAPLALLAPFSRRRKGRRGAMLVVAALLALALFLTGSAFASGTGDFVLRPEGRLRTTPYSVTSQQRVPTPYGASNTQYAVVRSLPGGRSTQSLISNL